MMKLEMETVIPSRPSPLFPLSTKVALFDQIDSRLPLSPLSSAALLLQWVISVAASGTRERSGGERARAPVSTFMVIPRFV